MIPRPDIISVESGCSIDDALDVAFEHGVSRLPVMKQDSEGREDILGIVYAKDLMRSIRSGNGASVVDSLVRSAVVLPENKPVAKLMREMQRDHFHMAIVADEYGSIAGLLTLEDCLEELVGEIVDEHDDEGPEITPLPNGESLVDAGISLSDFNEHFQMSLEEGEYDTLAGFLFGTFEYVPVVGEKTESGGWLFTIDAVEGRRITKVRVRPVVEADV
jgi:CBS domain containing-hemolysin-like protein